jgi:hypothetical protein
MNFFKTFFIFAILFSLQSCVTHKSPLQEKKGERFIFVSNNEKEVLRLAYSTIIDLVPEYPITDLDGPIRGYSVTRISLVDQYTSVVRIFPASGKTKSGEIVSGYYPEVSGSGTLFDGPLFDGRLYSSLLDELGKVAKQTYVTDLTRTEYQFDRDRWRLNDIPSLREGGTIKVITEEKKNSNSKSIKERLEELDELREENTISPSEYKKLREKLLNDL